MIKAAPSSKVSFLFCFLSLGGGLSRSFFCGTFRSFSQVGNLRLPHSIITGFTVASEVGRALFHFPSGAAPRDLVKKMTGSGKYLSLIENRLIAFGEYLYLSLTGNKLLRHIPPISWANRRTKRCLYHTGSTGSRSSDITFGCYYSFFLEPHSKAEINLIHGNGGLYGRILELR